MPPYTVRCYTPGCGQLAVYKIAARWSDGVTSELKCYGLTCATCLPVWLPRAQERHRACRLAAGEQLDPPGVYRLAAARDRDLERLPEWG
jgi:hypothetical protein